ncbi:hypothetical protein GOODEAATRI_008811, partial [Goodea atripinnis]
IQLELSLIFLLLLLSTDSSCGSLFIWKRKHLTYLLPAVIEIKRAEKSYTLHSVYLPQFLYPFFSPLYSSLFCCLPAERDTPPFCFVSPSLLCIMCFSAAVAMVIVFLSWDCDLA